MSNHIRREHISLVGLRDGKNQLGVKKIIESFGPQHWESLEWEYHDGARMIDRLLGDFPDLCDNQAVSYFLEMPHKFGFAIHTDTVRYVVSIIGKMDVHGSNSIFEPVVAIDSCIRTLENNLINFTNNTNLDTIAGLLCAAWDGSWWNNEGFRTRIWMLVKYANISIKHLYRARPDFVERMCMVEIESGTTDEKYRSSQLCELLNECLEELSLRHYKMIRELAEQTADKKILEALKQIKL